MLMLDNERGQIELFNQVLTAAAPHCSSDIWSETQWTL